MSARFLACDVCARHVREGDEACPFCGAKAPRATPPRSLTGRLTRAAMHAAGAAGTIVTLADCSSSSTGGGSVEAFYGAPCIDGSCTYSIDASADAGQDGPGVGTFDSASPVDAGAADADAGEPADGGAGG